jgi:hypothetical protein
VMSSHSEEIWESFDALWRRLQQLSNHVTELEARLGAIEVAGPREAAGELEQSRLAGLFHSTKEKSADERSS